MADVVELLEREPLTARGFLANASNHTLLVQVGGSELGVHAVYKPQAGERPLWDFPTGSLCRREVAAYLVSERLGWGLVPPTVLREDAPMGPGSVQLFVPHDPERHYFSIVSDPDSHPALVRMAVFDLLINNADRKASHVLIADDGRLLGCDHGLTFHTEPKLRTVIWDLGEAPLPEDAAETIGQLGAELQDGGPLGRSLAGLLADEEVDALGARARVLRGLERLPTVAPNRRPYPWPPL